MGELINLSAMKGVFFLIAAACCLAMGYADASAKVELSELKGSDLNLAGAQPLLRNTREAKKGDGNEKKKKSAMKKKKAKKLRKKAKKAKKAEKKAKKAKKAGGKSKERQYKTQDCEKKEIEEE